MMRFVFLDSSRCRLHVYLYERAKCVRNTKRHADGFVGEKKNIPLDSTVWGSQGKSTRAVTFVVNGQNRNRR